MPPTFTDPHKFIHPHTFIPPGCTHSPTCPPYSSVHLYILRGFYMLWGVVRGPLTGWILPLHLPLLGVPSLQFTTPTHLLASLCMSMFWGYLYVILGFFPYVGGLGVFPICWGFGASAHGVSICLFLYIFVVHYVSHFYYGYDYYSSS